MLLLVVAVVRQLMQSRYGELLVAVRDGEERVRFLGYDPANIKVVAYTVAALFASIAGALFAPIVGFIAPSQVGILPSIAFLIGVAIGGRTTLLGPVLGAIGVAWAQTLFSERFPSEWTYAQGLLFIVVVGFFPAGFAGLGVLLQAPAQGANPNRTLEQTPESEPDAEKVAPAHDRRSEHAGKEPVAGGNVGMGTQYLEVRGLTVDFDGFKAVSDVDLTLFQGDLRFLIGPNGAGKTTVIDAITGLVPAHRVDQQVRRRTARQEGAPDRPARGGAHLPDRERVRAADGAAEPRHRGRCGPVGVDTAAAAHQRAARRSRRRWRPSG